MNTFDGSVKADSVQTFDACLTIPPQDLVNLVNLDIQSQAMAEVTWKRGSVARC